MTTSARAFLACAMAALPLGVAAFAACSSDTFSAADAAAPDAPTTTVDAGDASAWVPCAQRPTKPNTFCDDFDDPLLGVGDKWVDTFADAGPHAVRDASTTEVVSPPHSFFSQLVGPFSGYAQATLRYRPPAITNASHLHYAFSLRVEPDAFVSALPLFDYLAVATVAFAPVPCDGGTRLRELGALFDSTGALRLMTRGFDGCSTGDYHTATMGASLRAVAGNWLRIDIDVQRGTSCGGAAGVATASARVNGGPVTCADLATDPFAVIDGVLFKIGLDTGNAASSGAAEFDDVELEAR